jgi:putative ABC transport system ATP-binding protein
MLQLEGVTVQRGSSQVPVHLQFDDVSVPQGGVLLLMGKSGSGKSTWLQLAAGLLAADAGRVTVCGRALQGLKQREKDHIRAEYISVLTQRPVWSAGLNVRDNLRLALWAAGRGSDDELIAQKLQAVQVADMATRMPAQLSGGQSVRCALARALLIEPQLILADEPTAHLDDENCALSLQVLAQAAKDQSASLVIATHDRRVLQALPSAAVQDLNENRAVAQRIY